METLSNIILILLCLILVYNYYETNILSVNDDKKQLERFINLRKYWYLKGILLCLKHINLVIKMCFSILNKT